MESNPYGSWEQIDLSYRPLASRYESRQGGIGKAYGAA